MACVRTALAGAATALAVTAAGHVWAIGPSFDCAKAEAPFAKLICGSRELSRVDLSYSQAYWALRQQKGYFGTAVGGYAIRFEAEVRERCRVPTSGPLPDDSSAMANCVEYAYREQRGAWLTELTGAAADEANRPLEEHVALQRDLQSLGFLPKSATIDGVYSTETRAAIVAWQHHDNLSETGFLSNAEAQKLEKETPGAHAESYDREAVALTKPKISKPLAEADYGGTRTALSYEDLSVIMVPGTSQDPQVCTSDGDGLQTPCPIVSVQGLEAGRSIFKIVTPNPYAHDGQSKQLEAKLTLRRLDPSTRLPQVVFVHSLGGAHDIKVYSIATEGKGRVWHVIQDENGAAVDHEFIDLLHNGVSELVGMDRDFMYAFSSGAGSNPPSSILAVNGTKLENVTKKADFRQFLIQQLDEMERDHGEDRSNGYWAGWVAQKALVGQLDEAWRIMLASYDHATKEDTGILSLPLPGLRVCRVNVGAWQELGGTGSNPSLRTCPNSEEVTVPFPEALALFLVRHGYITPDDSKRLGYDVAQIEADRTAAAAIGTPSYENRLAAKNAEQATIAAERKAKEEAGWHLITRVGECIVAPFSPADLITNDKALGLQDNVRVLKTGTDGKSTVVQVAEPKPGDMESIYTFFRGLEACTHYHNEQQQQLENLR